MIKSFQVGLLVLLSCICFETAATIYFKKQPEKSIIEPITAIYEQKTAARTKNTPRRTKRKASGCKRHAQNKNQTQVLSRLKSKLLGIYWTSQCTPSILEKFCVQCIKDSLPHLSRYFSHQHQPHTSHQNSHTKKSEEEVAVPNVPLLLPMLPTRMPNTNQSDRTSRLSLILRGITVLHYTGASSGKPYFHTSYCHAKVKQKIANFNGQTYELYTKGAISLRVLDSEGGAFKPFFPICCALIGFSLLLQI